MELITDLSEYRSDAPGAVTIGKFDGIHKGHQEILSRIIAKKSEGFKAIVFTFDPPPAVFLGFAENTGLMSRDEKRMVFESLGVDVLVEYQMNSETAAVSPEDFVEKILFGILNCRYLAVGTDVSFGDKGKGDARLLSYYNNTDKNFKNSFDLDIIEKVQYKGVEISSTLIRGALATGDMERVRELIGCPYCVRGEVIHGRHLGSKLGMPTLNLAPFPEKLLPPNGVYYSYVSRGGVHYPAISNIGCKPTVSDIPVRGVETYLYDFSGDMYGEIISVNLLSYKREEKKFDSIEALKAQMEEDIAQGRVYHRIFNGIRG